jgi:zona occludens toxin
MSAHLVAVDDVVEAAETGAPIVLVSGLPGSGKSLFSLAEFAVGKHSVYQAGIPGCVLPEWEPQRWQEMPAGSTLIVDEAQDFFPPKPPTGEPPAHYVLNKIRHKALALVLITQHPGNLDSRVRRLVGRHVHVVAAFGADAAVMYEWRGVGDVDNRSYDGAVRSGFKYPKEVYKLYKSADAHRPKQKAPFKVRAIPYIFGLVFVLLGVGGWIVFHSMSAVAHGDVPGSHGQTGGDSSRFVRAGNDRAVPLTAAEYATTFKPRVEGLDYSAPRYDVVTKPVRAPVPAACIANATKCSCYSQQATVLQVPESMCRQIVAGGYFKDFDDGDDQKRRDVVAAEPRAASVQPGQVPVGGLPVVPVAAAAGPAVASVLPLSPSGLVVIGGTYAPGH